MLAEMRGKTLKSYECYKPDGFNVTDGNFRLNLGRFAVDATCDLHALDGETAGFDEMAWFSCERVDLKSEFRPTVVAEPRQYMVNEVITSMELVRDHADYSDGRFVFDMDVAVVIRTKHHTFSFARGIWFADDISIEVQGPGCTPGNLYPVNELWPNGDMTVDVRRETLVLA